MVSSCNNDLTNRADKQLSRTSLSFSLWDPGGGGPKREREEQAEKNQREKKIKALPETPIHHRTPPPPPKALTAQAATEPNLSVTLPSDDNLQVCKPRSEEVV